MPRIKFGWEMAKFGIYIMFPIGVLALWGHSELYDLIPTSQDEIKHYKKLAEENTNVSICVLETDHPILYSDLSTILRCGLENSKNA